MCALVTSPGPEMLDTLTYPAQRIRYMNQHMSLQEGVTGELIGLDFSTLQRAAGANMSVDVQSGSAWVKGDTGTRQGLYHVVNDNTVNLTVGAAHATLPRIDQVILRIFDSTVAGVSDLPTLSVLAGTATSGATLDNRLGAAALPGDAIRLADIGVGAAVASIVNANIRDRRPWTRGAHASLNGPGSGVVTTTSLTYVDSLKFAARIECSGTASLEVAASASMAVATPSQAAILGIIMDGSVECARGLTRASNPETVVARSVINPGAGSHVFRLMYASSAGAVVNLYDDTVTSIPELSLRERVQQNSVNGAA